MGLGLRGLFSSALVSQSTSDTNKNNTDVADVPAAVQGQTSIDAGWRDDKLGATGTSDATGDSASDDEMTKVDTSAQRGVQNVQAMTLVWSKRDLILAYIMYVLYRRPHRASCANMPQDMVDCIRAFLRLRQHRNAPAICDVLLPATFSDCTHSSHLIPDLRSLEVALRENHGHLG